MSIEVENQDQKTPGNGKMFVGMLLLVLGVGFLLQQLDFFFIPNWLFSWESWLIIWGLYIGARNNFQRSSWLIMVVVGVVCLLDRIFPGYDLSRLLWPLGIIAVGIWFITKRNHSWNGNNKWGNKWENKFNRNQYGNTNPFEPVVTPVTPFDPANPESSTATPPSSGSTAIPPVTPFSGIPSGDDYLDAISIFGSVKKTILSKNFRGGEIVNVFGGAEIDFTQADINGRIIIDITQLFGGTKIIVPSNWQVVSDLAAVFAGVDDKRIRTGAPIDSGKTLVLKGVSIFAGVDIRSY